MITQIFQIHCMGLIEPLHNIVPLNLYKKVNWY